MMKVIGGSTGYDLLVVLKDCSIWTSRVVVEIFWGQFYQKPNILCDLVCLLSKQSLGSAKHRSEISVELKVVLLYCTLNGRGNGLQLRNTGATPRPNRILLQVKGKATEINNFPSFYVPMTQSNSTFAQLKSIIHNDVNSFR